MNGVTSARPVRVGIDGMNLAMPDGTGVATYARMLSRCLSGLGHPVDVLYDTRVSAKTPAALREILFFESLQRKPKTTNAGLYSPRHMREIVRFPFGVGAVQIPIEGSVIATPFDARMPAYERIFSVPDLFEAAARHFRRYRTFLTVHMADAPAIMHWTYPLPIRVAGARNVYTIHDLVPLKLPYTSLENKRYHYRLIRACLATADHICTVSEATRRDVLEMFPTLEANRITNTYQTSGIAQDDNGSTPANLAARLAGLFGLEAGGYFLYFGAIEPKKNLGRLLEAYLGAEVQTPLAIVGARSWLADNELRLLRGRGKEGKDSTTADADHGTRTGFGGAAGRIREFGYLPAQLLALLVKGARAVVFPSLYEGFGLPVLEAMSHGVPVLTSNVASLPEVAGDAALMVDPYDVGAIAQALQQLDIDDALCARLGAAGREQAALFSMTHYERRITALYQNVLSVPYGSRQPINSILRAREH
jgi:glycosyltransferase involved in cell wall biosynthesis